MAGHNKWSQIKHKKAATDAYKSRIFGKLARLIQIEAKKAGGNSDAPALKAIIARARAENMPSENIERAVRRASESKNLDGVLFEAYGPDGVGILIEALTDNNNRTSQEIRHLLSEAGVALGNPGSVVWNFEKKEGAWIPKTTVEISDSALAELEKLVEVIENHDDVQDVITSAA